MDGGVEVSDATHGANPLLAGGIGVGKTTQFFAQAADMDIDAAIKGAEGTAERCLREFFAGHYGSGAAQEKLKHVELGAGQLDGNAVARAVRVQQGEGDIADG